MVAKALHAELGNLRLIETNGVTVNNKLELFSILINADGDTTIFIDEAQGMNPKTQHVLLTALSEKKLYVPAGISSMCSCTIPLSNFTTILATTHEYLLQDAIRNRMRIYCRFVYRPGFFGHRFVDNHAAISTPTQASFRAWAGVR
jgi:Holliday junction resolvasome RuvABC ATP-dependent DNA helicase subunit